MINNTWEQKHYCCEPISKIENYELAVNDKDCWVIHHRFELCCPLYKPTMDELKKYNLYWNRPASELIFLTRKEHQRLHMIGKPKSTSHKLKMSKLIKCLETGEIHSGIEWRNLGYDSARKVAAHLPKRKTCKGLHFEYA